MKPRWIIELEDSVRHTRRAAELGWPAASHRLAASQPMTSELLAPDGEEAFNREMRLRSGPLREQWDARGRGLMRQLCRLTGHPPTQLENTRPGDAAVRLVAPVIGGHGELTAAGDGVLLEAVLANPHAELPEVLRLGWLLARLLLAPPAASSPADAGVHALALMMAVLAAGEAVELAACDLPTARLALDAWRRGAGAETWPSPEAAASHAPVLLSWWEEAGESATDWPQRVGLLAGKLR
ncbi:MAG: hypothetical protein AAF790_15845 [Planctomycetota bacterium]